MKTKKNTINAKVLFLDIETAPLTAWCWGLFDQNVGLNQIESDWHVMSWSAKWLHSKEIFYEDQRDAVDMENDKGILQKMWELIDEADIIIGHNLDRFDIKKLNARFILNGMKPPSSYRTEDTLKMARRKFAFTSNKLSYLTDKLCTKYKKLSHAKFAGFALWKECMKGNIKAWEEMRKYNIYDVLSLEELYLILAPWASKINYSVFQPDDEKICVCGNDLFIKNGYWYTNSGKVQRLKCTKCGSEKKESKNLLSKEKRKNLAR